MLQREIQPTIKCTAASCIFRDDHQHAQAHERVTIPAGWMDGWFVSSNRYATHNDKRPEGLDEGQKLAY